MTMPTPVTDVLDALKGFEFVRLTTFRKTGAPVPTPVWFAMEDGKIYMFTLAAAGKLKRLRHTSRVKVAPCDYRGNLLGPEFEASAHILPGAQEEMADSILGRKYGWQLAVLKLFYRWRNTKRIFIEIGVASL